VVHKKQIIVEEVNVTCDEKRPVNLDCPKCVERQTTVCVNCIGTQLTASRQVDHPSHYTKGKFEVIDVIEDWQLNFNLGNVVKYLARANYKGNKKEDLEKALWYLTREINN